METDNILLKSAGCSGIMDGAGMVRNVGTIILLNSDLLILPRVQKLAAADRVVGVVAGVEGAPDVDVVDVEADEVVMLLSMKVATTMAPQDENVEVTGQRKANLDSTIIN